MDIKRVGLWLSQFDGQPATRVREAAAEIEALGYGAIWLSEAFGREAFSAAGLVLSATGRIPVATGVANIWVRDPLATVAGQRSLAEAYPDRFLLGIGVSHAELVEGPRGHRYRRPLETMRRYLDAMDEVAGACIAVPPAIPPPRVLAALGPRMLELAASRSRGAHTYLVPPEHTARARDLLGAERWLVPEQAVVLETDPGLARLVARQHTSIYLALPNYVNNLLRLGFTEEELVDGGSDRLVDAVVAWGDADAVARRVRQHHDAGADHVCLQVLAADQATLPLGQWRELAAVLL
jgi:probable F420-dependent oxidoreductase